MDEITPKTFNLFGAVRGTGYKAGTYKVNGRLRALTDKDAGIIRQIDRVMLRLICQNYEAMIKLAGGNDPEALIDATWSCFGPVRLLAWGEGEYQIKMPGDIEVKFSLNAYDEHIFREYASLVKRISK